MCFVEQLGVAAHVCLYPPYLRHEHGADPPEEHVREPHRDRWTALHEWSCFLHGPGHKQGVHLPVMPSLQRIQLVERPTSGALLLQRQSRLKLFSSKPFFFAPKESPTFVDCTGALLGKLGIHRARAHSRETGSRNRRNAHT